METIAAPTIKDRDLKIDKIFLGTEDGQEEIAIICSCIYKNANGDSMSASTIRLSYKDRDHYSKDGKLYSQYTRVYNYLFPTGSVTKARDHVFEKARNLVKEYLEQYEGVDAGTYNKDSIPDPDSIGDAPAPPSSGSKTIPADVTSEPAT